jgi:EAL domain-containing protein (putative c-di-GMP-specific phosphodiesterase class I)
VSVNLSARQLWGGGLVRMVADIVSDTGMSEQLEMELTESMVMHDAENVIATLQGPEVDRGCAFSWTTSAPDTRASPT